MNKKEKKSECDEKKKKFKKTDRNEREGERE